MTRASTLRRSATPQATGGRRSSWRSRWRPAFDEAGWCCASRRAAPGGRERVVVSVRESGSVSSSGLSSPLVSQGATGAGPTRSSRHAVEEFELLARLRAGDERAFTALVDAHHCALIALALTHVRTHEVAEEVAQETWVAVLDGIDRFRGRSSLKTWILRILVNTAITRGGREARVVPFSTLEPADTRAPALDPERFRPAGDALAGHWQGSPPDWSALPEQSLLGREALEVAKRAIEALPDAQRRVITMRDIAGLSADDVCEALGLSDGNQRVLLHRARSRVRAALEVHLDG